MHDGKRIHFSPADGMQRPDIKPLMTSIYWILDSPPSDQVLTRVLIAYFVIIYGVFTQILINSREAALQEEEETQRQLIQSEKLVVLGVVAAAGDRV
jgi:hypothetical protein